MAVEPRPIIARPLIALVIPPPAALGDPLRQHVHHLALLGLIVEEVFREAHEHHLPLVGDLHRLHKHLDLAGLHGEIHNGTDRDDEHDGEEAGKAKPQGRMPVRGPITTLDLAVDLLDARDFRRGGILHPGEFLDDAGGIQPSRTFAIRFHAAPPSLRSRGGVTRPRKTPRGLPWPGSPP